MSKKALLLKKQSNVVATLTVGLADYMDKVFKKLAVDASGSVELVAASLHFPENIAVIGGGYSINSSIASQTGVMARAFANITIPFTADFSHAMDGAYGSVAYICYKSTGLTGVIDISKVTNVSGGAWNSSFEGCTGISINNTFNIKNASYSAFGYCFADCTQLAGAIYFPEVSWLDYDGLKEMFSGCTGITEIHLKSTAPSDITGAYLGCANATVYRDL